MKERKKKNGWTVWWPWTRINGLPRETKWISNSQTPVKKHSLTQKKDDDDDNDNTCNNYNNNNNTCTTNKMMMITIIMMIIIIILIIKRCCVQIRRIYDTRIKGLVIVSAFSAFFFKLPYCVFWYKFTSTPGNFQQWDRVRSQNRIKWKEERN